jgi:oligopeptide/dipeptide ABC transporter ATP-binding protein
MYRGRIVEIAPSEMLFTAPAHSYTRALLSAIPTLRPGEKLERIPYDGSQFQRLELREVSPGHWVSV